MLERYCSCSSCRRRAEDAALSLGAAFISVWEQADRNHRAYSDMGDVETDIRFLALGLTGEAGELANFVKKRWRDGDRHERALQLEVADVCAYAFMLADLLGLTPASLIEAIAEKQSSFVAKMKLREASQ